MPVVGPPKDPKGLSVVVPPQARFRDDAAFTLRAATGERIVMLPGSDARHRGTRPRTAGAQPTARSSTMLI